MPAAVRIDHGGELLVQPCGVGAQRMHGPPGLGQAILGALVFWAFPIAWHHSMHVGPGYYSYVSR